MPKTLFALKPVNGQIPASGGATVDEFEGGATPNESLLINEFDAASVQSVDFPFEMPQQYEGRGINLKLKVGAKIATAGDVVIRAGVRRVNDGAALGGAHTYSWQSVTYTVPDATTKVKYATLSFTNAQIDGLLKGEMGNLRVQRNIDDEADTASGEARLHLIGVEEPGA